MYRASSVPAAYADQQADAANLARLELAEVQQAAQRKVERLQQDLHAAEAQLQAARNQGVTPGQAGATS